MQAKAISYWVRVSYDKTRLLTRELQGKKVDEALQIARFAKTKSARPVLKCLESAIANAEENFDMDVDALYVKEARVDKGPFLKRVSPNSRGRADMQKKHTSHIMIVVTDEAPKAKQKRGKSLAKREPKKEDAAQQSAAS
jgi:large subunit ribosomal protein L22